jgi:uncharacterized protein YunC (DUF1805 family)
VKTKQPTAQKLRDDFENILTLLNTAESLALRCGFFLLWRSICAAKTCGAANIESRLKTLRTMKPRTKKDVDSLAAKLAEQLTGKVDGLSIREGMKMHAAIKRIQEHKASDELCARVLESYGSAPPADLLPRIKLVATSVLLAGKKKAKS